MTVKALEVRLNGKKLYTVGMENWRMMGASITGSRYTQADIEKIKQVHEEPIPGLGSEGISNMNLYAYVGVPDEDLNRPGGSSGQNYESHTLSVGDEVTVRVIETDQPDKPMPPHPGGPGVLALKSSRDPE